MTTHCDLPDVVCAADGSRTTSRPASTTTGIRNVSRPRRWLVPPWEASAGVCDVVQHFSRFEPWHVTESDIANQLAYYQGLARALGTASTAELRHTTDWRWYEELRTVIGRCVTACKEQELSDTVYAWPAQRAALRRDQAS